MRGLVFIKEVYSVGQERARRKRLGAACAINMRAACGMGIKNNIDVRLGAMEKSTGNAISIES
jgi:hypothetical protein